jgi:Fe-S-cluster containining protein
MSASWAQLPSFALCVAQCRAACCRAPGSLVLSAQEASRLALRAGPLTLYDEGGNRHRLNFSDHGGQCPALNADSTCRVYADRPVACHRFPSHPDPRCAVWPAMTET